MQDLKAFIPLKMRNRNDRDANPTISVYTSNTTSYAQLNQAAAKTFNLNDKKYVKLYIEKESRSVGLIFLKEYAPYSLTLSKIGRRTTRTFSFMGLIIAMGIDPTRLKNIHRLPLEQTGEMVLFRIPENAIKHTQ